MAETFNVNQVGNSTEFSYSPSSSGTVTVPDNAVVKGNASSASGFSQTYGSDAYLKGLDVSSGLTNGLNDIYNMVEFNNAVARANAFDQREWQRRMMYETYFLNAAEAGANRKWQEYMSNTAHQREVHDLLAAGLNPVLSAGGGHGASVGSGAQASISSPSTNAAQNDMSGTSAIMSMLGSLISANTQMATASLNAQNQMAIADKNIASAQLIAELNAKTLETTGKYSSDNALKAAYAAANASIYSSNMQWQLNQLGNSTNMWHLISSAANAAGIPYGKTWRNAVTDFFALFGITPDEQKRLDKKRGSDFTFWRDFLTRGYNFARGGKF